MLAHPQGRCGWPSHCVLPALQATSTACMPFPLFQVRPLCYPALWLQVAARLVEPVQSHLAALLKHRKYKPLAWEQAKVGGFLVGWVSARHGRAGWHTARRSEQGQAAASGCCN